MQPMMNLYGLGASPEMQSAIDGFLVSAPAPSTAQIADFLKLYAGPSRSDAAQALIASGVDSTKVTSSMQFLSASGAITKSTVWGLLSVASAAASGYHGIRRNHGSIGYGILWFFLGGLAPVLVPVVAVAQGFAKPKAK